MSVVVYSLGIVAASVCTDEEPEEMLATVNAEYPTGISSEWQISDDPKFRGGESNPCPCEQNPKTHKHYLLEC